MDLFDFSYPQQDIVHAMKTVGIPLDEGSVIPWVGGSHAILDKTGNMAGFAFNNQMGGVYVTDTTTNVKASTMANERGGANLFSENFQQVGRTEENVFGGFNIYDENHQLDMFSQPNLFKGEDFHSHDFQLLGMTHSMPGKIDFNQFTQSSGPAFESPDLPSFFHGFTMDENLFEGELSTNVFDILELL